jgi:hypothetical protein
MMNRVIAMITGLTLMVSLSWAATADQAGTYSGTVKTVLTGASGRSVTKKAMEIQIAEDNSTTVTLDGVVQLLPSGGFYGTTAGAILFGTATPGPTSDVFLAEFIFKGSTIKGTGTGAVLNTGPPLSLSAAAEIKFRLKKQ